MNDFINLVDIPCDNCVVSIFIILLTLYLYFVGEVLLAPICGFYDFLLDYFTTRRMQPLASRFKVENHGLRHQNSTKNPCFIKNIPFSISNHLYDLSLLFLLYNLQRQSCKQLLTISSIFEFNIL